MVSDRHTYAINGRRALLILLSVSFLMKLPLLASKWGLLMKDGIEYVTISRHIAAGEFALAFSGDYLPFYPFLIAIFNFIIRDWAASALLVSFFCGWLVIIPFYLLIKGIFDEETAFLAALFFAVVPTLNFISTGVGSDATFLAFFVLSLYSLWLGRSGGKVYYVAVSFGFALLALLTRNAGVVLFPIIVLWTTLFLRGDRKRLLRTLAAVVVASVILVVIIWSVASSGGSGKFYDLVAFLKGGSFSHMGEISAELKASEKVVPGGKYFDFFEVARHYIPLVYLIGLVDVFVRSAGFAITPFIFLGLFPGRREGHSAGHRGYLITTAIFYFALCYVFFLYKNFIEPRYAVPVVVMLLPWAALGFLWLRRVMRDRFGLNAAFVSVVIALIVVAGTGYKYKSVFKKSRANIVTASRWIEANVDASALIVTNQPAVPFSAGRSYKEDSCSTLKSCLKAAGKQGGDYLVLEVKRKSIEGSEGAAAVFRGKRVDIFVFKLNKGL